MKLNRIASVLVIGLVVCIAASGCKKKPVGVTNLPGERTGKVPDMPPGGQLPPSQPTTGESGVTGVAGGSGTPGAHESNPAGLHDGWIKDPEALRAQTVYFDFDSTVIKASEKPKVAAVADFLKGKSGKAVLVEGNCDERGTEEYNRSLGERRALAVREELIRLGIGPTEVDTISYGKDKPIAQGHDESAWKQNRRDDFVVLTKPGS